MRKAILGVFRAIQDANRFGIFPTSPRRTALRRNEWLRVSGQNGKRGSQNAVLHPCILASLHPCDAQGDFGIRDECKAARMQLPLIPDSTLAGFRRAGSHRMRDVLGALSSCHLETHKVISGAFLPIKMPPTLACWHLAPSFPGGEVFGLCRRGGRLLYRESCQSYRETSCWPRCRVWNSWSRR